MAKFRFIGKHTGGRTSISLFGVTFEGVEPADVTSADGIRRLSNHIEFEAVDEPHDEAPRKRGRPKKEAAL